MRIAFVTDDERTVSQHFGRARYYLVVTLEDGQIVERERREKPGHAQFAGEAHDHEQGVPVHVHERGSERAWCSGPSHPNGRGRCGLSGCGGRRHGRRRVREPGSAWNPADRDRCPGDR